MNTPEWFGSIGVMNSAHLHRHGLIARLRLAVAEVRAAAGRLRFPGVQAPSLLRTGRTQGEPDRAIFAPGAHSPETIASCSHRGLVKQMIVNASAERRSLGHHSPAMWRAPLHLSSREAAR